MKMGDLVRVHSIHMWDRLMGTTVPYVWLQSVEDVERLDWILMSDGESFVDAELWFTVKPSGGPGWTEDLISRLRREDGDEYYWYVPERCLRMASQDPIDTASYRDVVTAAKTPKREPI